MTEDKKTIEYLPIDALIPYARNSRTHSDGQVAQIAASIREFGFTNPVLIDAGGGIIAGHGRVMGARKLGMTEVPCIRLGHLSEAQRRAYVIADNKLALNAGWDGAMLAGEVRSLMAMDFDPLVTGFTDAEINDLLELDSPAHGTDPDSCPPADASGCVTNKGDVWIMGEHRMVCGDCTDASVMLDLMQGAGAAAVWTDPPYNVAVGAKKKMLNNYKRGVRGGRNTADILNDEMGDDNFRAFIGAFYQSAMSIMAEGAVIYVSHSETQRAIFTGEFLRAGFKLSSVIIWLKNHFSLGRADYQWIHEPILYGRKPGAARRWHGGRKKDHGSTIRRRIAICSACRRPMGDTPRCRGVRGGRSSRNL